MIRAIKNLFGIGKVSKTAAKSRLHFVLVQDRTGLTNEELAGFRGELVEVIQNYFEIDEQGFDIDYEREGDTTRLVINSPVIVRRQDSPEKLSGSERRRAGNDSSNGSTSGSASSSTSGRARGSRRARRKRRGSGAGAEATA